MYLHNPPNLNLPPLMLEKTQAREEMEQSPTVYSFIKSKLLLDPDFHRVFTRIQKKSDEIEEMMRAFKEDSPFIYRPLRLPVSGRRIAARRFLQLRRLLYVHGSQPKFKNKKEEEEFNKTLLELKSEMYKGLITQIKRKSSEIQNTLSRFEEPRNQFLEILTSSTLFICKRCHNIVSRNRFMNTTCACGVKITRVSDIRKEPIAFFDPRLRAFIANNYWFEHGVDYLLRKKNFQTLCGVHVLGHSGCLHEIDNIAESKTSNLRIFGECKTGEIKTNDVFVLAGKMADIGCSRAYIFTLSKDVQKQISHLARSRNISTVDDVLSRPVGDVIKEIRED
ncbi:hypothetical protein HQ563_14475 [bacterium]|nr:hypothetical protein [bacterium]